MTLLIGAKKEIPMNQAFRQIHKEQNRNEVGMEVEWDYQSMAFKVSLFKKWRRLSLGVNNFFAHLLASLCS